MARDAKLNINTRDAQKQITQLTKEVERFTKLLQQISNNWQTIAKEINKATEEAKSFGAATKPSAQAFRRTSFIVPPEGGIARGRPRTPPPPPPPPPPDPYAQYRWTMQRPPQGATVVQHPVTKKFMSVKEAEREQFFKPEYKDIYSRAMSGEGRAEASRRAEAARQAEIQKRYGVFASGMIGPGGGAARAEEEYKKARQSVSRSSEQRRKEKEEDDFFKKMKQTSSQTKFEDFFKPKKSEGDDDPKVQAHHILRDFKDIHKIVMAWTHPRGWVGAMERTGLLLARGGASGTGVLGGLFGTLSLSPAMLAGIGIPAAALGAIIAGFGGAIAAAPGVQQKWKEATGIGIPTGQRQVMMPMMSRMFEQPEGMLQAISQARYQNTPAWRAQVQLWGLGGLNIAQQQEALKSPQNWGAAMAQNLELLRKHLEQNPVDLARIQRQVLPGLGIDPQDLQRWRDLKPDDRAQAIKDLTEQSKKQDQQYDESIEKLAKLNLALSKFTTDLGMAATKVFSLFVNPLISSLDEIEYFLGLKKRPGAIEGGGGYYSPVIPGAIIPGGGYVSPPSKKAQKGGGFTADTPANGSPPAVAPGSPFHAAWTPGPTNAAMSLAGDGTSQWMKNWFRQESSAAYSAATAASQRDEKITDLMEIIEKREDKTQEVNRNLLQLIKILEGKDKKNQINLAGKGGAAGVGYTGPQTVATGGLGDFIRKGGAIAPPGASPLIQEEARGGAPGRIGTQGPGGISVPPLDVKGGYDIKGSEASNKLMSHVMSKYGLTREQAAGIVGNLSVESGGFTKFHEMGQPAEKGGIGYAQWTGSRRRDFEAFAASKGLDPHSYAANEAMLDKEFSGDYAKVIEHVKQAQTSAEASTTFLKEFEKPADIPGNIPVRARTAEKIASGYVSPVMTAHTASNELLSIEKQQKTREEAIKWGAKDAPFLGWRTNRQYPNSGPTAAAEAATAPGTGADLIKGTQRGATGSDQAKAVDDLQKMMGLNDCNDRDAIRKYLGNQSFGMDPHEEPWCAMTVNAALQHAGIKGSGSALAKSFANWGTAVAPGDIGKGDVGEYKSGAHVGLLTGAHRGEGANEEVQIIAGNEFAGRRSDPTRDKTQIGQVGTHWMKLSDLNVRRAAGQVGGGSAVALPGSSTTVASSNSSTRPDGMSVGGNAPAGAAVANACGCGGAGLGGGMGGGNPLGMLGSMLGGRFGGSMGGMLGGMLGNMLGGGPLATSNWQAPDKHMRLNVASSIGADISMALAQIAH